MARANPRRQAVLLFNEGTAETMTPAMRGGKGSSLARMSQLGIPVPTGFTATTTVARAWQEHGRLPKRVDSQIERSLIAIEKETGRGFGCRTNPLLLSVRSGAAVSMPGMMDTVLNVGLNPQTVTALSDQYGKYFAFDSYRRFLQQFAVTVLGLEDKPFNDALSTLLSTERVVSVHELSVDSLSWLCEHYRHLIEILQSSMIDNPREQLYQALVAIIDSWNGERASGPQRK